MEGDGPVGQYFVQNRGRHMVKATLHVEEEGGYNQARPLVSVYVVGKGDNCVLSTKRGERPALISVEEAEVLSRHAESVGEDPFQDLREGFQQNNHPEGEGVGV